MVKEKKKEPSPRHKKKPSSDNGFENIFCQVIMAARRAKELIMGEKPLIDTQLIHPCLIALEEIKRGKVKYK